MRTRLPFSALALAAACHAMAGGAPAGASAGAAASATATSAAGAVSSKTSKGQAPMSNDPYFQALGLELIEPPASSRAALAASGGPAPPPVPPKADFPIEQARSWVLEVLRAPYQPPAGTPFVAIAAEDGRFDVVRAAYQAGGYEIEVGQSVHVLSLRLRRAYAAFGGPDEARAEAAARDLFATDVPLRFAGEGAFQLGASHGRRSIPPTGPVDPSWPHWVDQLRFWTNGTDIGFLTLKAAGGPTRAVISPLDGPNRAWFK